MFISLYMLMMKFMQKAARKILFLLYTDRVPFGRSYKELPLALYLQEVPKTVSVELISG